MLKLRTMVSKDIITLLQGNKGGTMSLLILY